MATKQNDGIAVRERSILQDKKMTECEDRMLKMAVPSEFFMYVGPGDRDGNSTYKCLKCSSSIISCHDRSRQNLKKRVMVGLRISTFC